MARQNKSARIAAGINTLIVRRSINHGFLLPNVHIKHTEAVRDLAFHGDAPNSLAARIERARSAKLHLRYDLGRMMKMRDHAQRITRYELPKGTPQDRLRKIRSQRVNEAALRILRHPEDMDINVRFAAPGEEANMALTDYLPGARFGGSSGEWEIVVPRNWTQTVQAWGLTNVYRHTFFVLSATRIWQPFTPPEVHTYRARIARQGRGYKIVCEDVIIERNQIGSVYVVKSAPVVRARKPQIEVEETEGAVDVSEFLAA